MTSQENTGCALGLFLVLMFGACSVMAAAGVVLLGAVSILNN
jgi:hypothetical protein